ncbi:MAG: 30S ribosomal protein S8 [Deltaproteobacteria bacterium]|nr:30S ribosomal protein S8 [Deltaproteobacteria bacterium]
MSMTDPVADLLTRIRNASHAGHESVSIPCSRLKLDILRLLKEEGFIMSFQEQHDGPHATIRVQIRYDASKKGVIRGIQRISRPSRRVYVRRDQIPFVRNGLGLAILTTPKGVLTDREARREGVGGEILCYIW